MRWLLRQGVATLQEVLYRAGMCTSNRTCHSTGGLRGTTSTRIRALAWCWQLRDKNTYKDTSSASRGWTLAAKTLDLAIGLHLVILQDGQLDLLALVLDLLGGLYTSQELKDQGSLLTWRNIRCTSFSCASSRHRVSGERGEGWTLFGCCSHSKCDHPRVAFLRK